MTDSGERALRLPDNEDGIAGGAEATGKVCYWFWENRWWLWLPGGGLADLSKHTVVEHEDRTITVTPSIQILSYPDAPGEPRSRQEREMAHGFLERGIWRDV